MAFDEPAPAEIVVNSSDQTPSRQSDRRPLIAEV